MGKKFKQYKQKFRKQWLEEDQFRKWLREVPGDPGHAHCKFCRNTINAKYNDIRRHSKSKKHLKAISTNLITVHYDEENFEDTIPSLIIGDDKKSRKPSGGDDINKFFSSFKQNVNQDTSVVPLHQEGASEDGRKELIIPASIGFVGCGNMAQALMNAFLGRGLVEPQLLMASAPSNRNLDKLPSGLRTTNNNNKVMSECDIIFICVKPHLMMEMIEGLDPLERDHSPLFISVVTGYSLSTLEQLLSSIVEAPRVVRTMPNTPCMVGQGCCVYTLGSNTNESDSKVVHSMLNSVGFCSQVPEYQIDAVCGLAGSGPAYIYAAIEALADGGVKMGLPRQLSQSLAAHMVKGAATMVLETGKHPGQLKDDVCSPSGTTITAMHSLEKSGFRNALISAVEASANRSKELGGKAD